MASAQERSQDASGQTFAESQAASPQELDALRAARGNWIRQWLQLKLEDLPRVYANGMGKEFMRLAESGLPHEPLAPDERARLDALRSEFSAGLAGKGALQALQAALLYQRPFLLQPKPELAPIPAWWCADYLKLLLALPSPFQAAGEAEAYYNFLCALAAHIRGQLPGKLTEPFWQNAVSQYLLLENSLLAPVTDKNVKEYYRLRGEIFTLFAKIPAYQPPPRPLRPKIRVGFIKLSFGYSPETFAILPLLEHLGPDFEIYLYSSQPFASPFAQYCGRQAACLRVLKGDDFWQGVKNIRADDLDFAFFATNLTANAKGMITLALCRLARIQVASVASISTSGLPLMDYYISGEYTEPAENAQDAYTERLLKLPGSAHCFSFGPDMPRPGRAAARADFGFAPDDVVLVSMASFFKILPEWLDVWAQILSRVGNAKLLLFPYNPFWDNKYPKRRFAVLLNEALARHGVAGNRAVIVEQRGLNRHDVREALKQADLYLDSFPFSATTSLLEPFEAGLPVICCRGQNLRSAMGAALLREAGLPELVASSPKEYVELAVRLASESGERRRLGLKIKERMALKPKFINPPEYGRQVAQLFKQLMRTHGFLA